MNLTRAGREGCDTAKSGAVVLYCVPISSVQCTPSPKHTCTHTAPLWGALGAWWLPLPEQDSVALTGAAGLDWP